jgi:hypothetical protein
MVAAAAQATPIVLATLQENGVLLLSDAVLPSVLQVVTGRMTSLSWWSKPVVGESDSVYWVLTQLDDHPDVVSVKLISGRVTLVHRRLWPALLGVATAREDWQLAGLTAGAKWLLHQVDTADVQTNNLALPATVSRKDVARAARELERRLLLHATDVHTPSGAHAKVLETWLRWSERSAIGEPPLAASAGKELFEATLQRLDPSGGADRLPWTRDSVRGVPREKILADRHASLS